MASPPTDPLFRYQWFLHNTGQSGGAPGSDINVLPVWADYTGQGVLVSIVDSGTQLDHPDLAANIVVDKSWDAVTDRPGGNPVGTSSASNHGTAVAGLVGEVANNGIGGAGVAWGASLMAVRLALAGDGDAGLSDRQEVIAFQKSLENGADVVNNSWGSSAAFANNAGNPANAEFFAALNALATQGRAGKGSVVVFANGNDGAARFDGNLDNVLNSRHVIAVGAVDDAGVRAAYSTPGANLLVAAPAGGSTDQDDRRPGNADLTTDRTGSLGYNTLEGAAGDYAYNFNGTSAAAPVVSGVVALMLQANPDLGYRDVQEILARSARFIDVGADAWVDTHPSTGVWNGGAALFNRNYGFGAVDAHGAVRLAEVYPYLHAAPRGEANLVVATAASGAVNLPLAADQSTTFGVALPSGVSLNHLDLALSAQFANASFLTVSLTSPSGTTIDMIQTPQNAAGASAAWPAGGFAMGTDAFWGETSGGTWTVTVRLGAGAPAGIVLSGSLAGWGDAASTVREFVYTDSFAAAVTRDTWVSGTTPRGTLAVQPGETAMIDAAAMSGAVYVNLATGQAEIGGQPIAIAAGTNVTRVLSGDGNDTLIGDGADNGLLAGRGSNALDGGAGVDTALYIGSRANYTASYTAAGTWTANSQQLGLSDTAVHIERAAFSEGTLYVQAASDAGLDIGALYNGLLFRAIDADGYRYWTNEAAAGTGVPAIEAGFLGSAEYAAGPGTLGNEAFVEGAYQNLLGRAADAAGLAYWTAQLAGGAQTRADMVLSVSHSTEYDQTRLVGLFDAIDSLGNLWS